MAQPLEPTTELNLSPPDETQQFNRKDHPPPLGQRERSTSAPNVCYNLVGQSAEISDDLLHRITKGTYNTLHGNLRILKIMSLPENAKSPIILYIAIIAIKIKCIDTIEKKFISIAEMLNRQQLRVKI